MTQRARYRRNAFTTTAVTVVPSARAFATAACHTSSGTRRARFGLITLAALASLALVAVAVAALAVVYDRNEQARRCYVHTCSYDCGEAAEECGRPCSRCAADEAESDAWLQAHRDLSPEERLLGAVQLSGQQAAQRREAGT